MRKFKLKYLLLVVSVICGMSVPFIAQSAKGYNKSINIIAGKADTVVLRGDVVDILVADPSIADVGTLRSDRLYIVGKSIGDTNILAYDDAGNQLANIDVHVRVDDKSIQDTLRSFFPEENIKAKTVRSNIVLSGTVSNPAISNQVRDLASRFLTAEGQTIVDLMNVTGEHQVMLKVKVVEAQRAALREVGINTSINSGGSRGLTFTGNNVGLAALSPFGTGTLLVGGSKTWGPLSATLNALETQGLVNTLAEPNLTAISGETAGFLAGGEYPVPAARDSNGNVTLEFKQFGVSLNFTPTVLSKDRIALHLSTEVSEQDPNSKVTLVDMEVNGLRVRRAETTVEVGSGNTIMIAGLIKSETLDSLNGLPGAQDVPVLGELFKSKSFKRNESELLIMVTPYLVKPYSEPEAVAGVVEPTPMQKQLGESFGIESRKVLSSKEPVRRVNKSVVAKKQPRKLPIANKMVTQSDDEKSSNVLTKSFMKNLTDVYGKQVPKNVSYDDSFGYIVD